MASRRKTGNQHSQPPALVASFNGTKTIRFYVVNNGTYVMQINDLLDLICVATSATTAYRLFDSVRLRKIEMWASSPSGTNNTLVSVEDINSSGVPYLTAKSQSVQDMVVGTARAAHLVYRPTAGTVQSSWFTASNGSTAGILSLSVPPGAVIDVTIEYTMADGNQGPSATASSITSATAGNVYCRALCVSQSATGIIPAGLANR